MRRSCFFPKSISPLLPSFSRRGWLAYRASLLDVHRQRPRAFSVTPSRFMDPAMGSNQIHYEFIEDVEALGYYQQGGYHPVKIGDHLHDRYRVVHKLGHGTYSTIWLARDEKVNKHVALKICVAHSNPLEIGLLSKLSEFPTPHHMGATMIPPVLDDFTITGPNGTHACLVTDPARMSLSDAKDVGYLFLFQIDVARALVAQLVIAVEYMHSRGFVHGDLHRGNILLKLQSTFQTLSTKELYETYGEPDLQPVVRSDSHGQTLQQPLPEGVPTHGVVPIWLGEACDKVTLAGARVVLSDFGHTFCPTQENRFESWTPLHLRPPEVLFQPGTPLTFPSDIWTLACTMWDIMGQRTLFEGFLTDDDDMTAQQIAMLGPLPREWWENWKGRADHFSETGEVINKQTSQYRTLEYDFERYIQFARSREGMPVLDERERDAFLAMMRSMLAFRPQERLSAKQLLESEWMVEWGIPEFEKVKRLSGC